MLQCIHCGAVTTGEVRCEHGWACNWCSLFERAYPALRDAVLAQAADCEPDALIDGGACICGEINARHCPVHNDGGACICGEINARHCPVHNDGSDA